jgi:3',5'-cyclic AMP phosphodiesterase CpdA
MSRILQITDLHIAVPPRLVSNELNTYKLLEMAIDRILVDWELIGPVDAVVVTGDISDIGDIESYQAFRRQVERLPVPYYVIPGNHDLRESMHQCFRDMVYMPDSGKINWIRDLHDIRLVGLDTLVPKSSGGELSEDTLEFLVAALGEAPEKPTLIAMHHPPFLSGIRFMDEIGLQGIEQLEKILRSTKNDIRIICGHLHGTIIGSVGNTVAIVSPATASSFDADYRDNAPIGFTTRPGGYMIHDWDNGFRSTCVPFTNGTGPHPF